MFILFALGGSFPYLPLINKFIYVYIYIYPYMVMCTCLMVSIVKQSITKVMSLNTCPPDTSTGTNNADVICKCLVYKVAVCIHSLYNIPFNTNE